MRTRDDLGTCVMCARKYRGDGRYCSIACIERGLRPAPPAGSPPVNDVVLALGEAQKGGACAQCGKPVGKATKMYCDIRCNRRAYVDRQKVKLASESCGEPSDAG